jgi:hypothetical protein
VYLSSTNDVSNDLQIAEVGSATSSEPVGMANLTESLDTLARVASQDTTHASLLNLISRGAFSVCSLIKISNPSPTDLMFIAAIPQFGIEYTIFLAKEFEWKCERVARALAEYALSEPAVTAELSLSYRGQEPLF